MGIMSFVAIAAALGIVLFLLWTMPVGQRVAIRLGLKGFHGEGAGSEDREFLLRECGGDKARVETLLREARRDHPELTDAEVYRKAIRTHLRYKHGGKVA
jgi:hypothetical protein